MICVKSGIVAVLVDSIARYVDASTGLGLLITLFAAAALFTIALVKEIKRVCSER